jgi:predicted transcriptional regulator
LKPRSRTISIRLSEEEFLTLKHLCSVTGARSVSDLTRDAMRVALHGVNRDDILGFRMDEFGALLKDLDRKLDQLAAGIESFKGER